MQAQLASGYVGQTVKLALGKSHFLSRVSLVDSPVSHPHDTLSFRHSHGIEPARSTYWPGTHYGRLRIELFPRSGPLSHPHFLVQKHASRASKSHSSSTSATSDDVEAPLDSSSTFAPSHSTHDSIAPQYITTPRGTLLDLCEHAKYHEAIAKSAVLFCQVPMAGSMPAVKRGALESASPVVAVESELKMVTSYPKMIIGGFEAGNLKPQRRALLERISRTSNAFFRDTFGPIPKDGPYVHPSDRLAQRFEQVFGQESFNIDDVASLQRLQRQSNDDPHRLLPPLTQTDVVHYETTLEAIREAIESRWSKFGETKLSGARSHNFRVWDANTAAYYAQIAMRLQYARREEIRDVAEQLKPLLNDARRANPNARPKAHEKDKSKSQDISKGTQVQESNGETATEEIQMEKWPTIFEDAPTALPTHLKELWKDDIARSIIVSLALYATSTISHPMPQGAANLISNFVLQPLGYQANPNGAQVLLTQLGLPVTDPLDIPYVLNLEALDLDGKLGPLRAYPWLSNHLPLSLESMAERESSVKTPEMPSLDAISPRHKELFAASDLSRSMCELASSILEKSGVEDSAYLKNLVAASKSPEFHFSRNVSSISGQSIPTLLKDSSTLLSHMDLDREERVDVSDLKSFAIDDVSTTEVDDAFSLDVDPLLPHSNWILNHLVEYVSRTHSNTPHPQGQGHPPPNLPKTARVLIHIADPTAVMRVGDALEMGARERVETMYLPHRKSVMLPSILSEFYCSLQPAPHMNMALTFEAHVNMLTGALEKMDVYPTKFRNMERVSYERVQAVLHGGDASVSDSDSLSLKLLFVLSQLRKIWRTKVGKAETMHIPKSGVKVDLLPSSLESLQTSSTSSSSISSFSSAEGVANQASSLKPRIRVFSESGLESSRSLVEEMMVLVGEITGKSAVTHGFSVPFRAQPFRTNLYVPSSELQLALGSQSLHNPEHPTMKSVKECETTRRYLVHNLQSLTFMNQSETTSTPAEHRSLGLSLYSRASSPLRRYADIIAHFQLKAWRRYGGDLSKMEYSPALVHSLSQQINSTAKDIKYTQQTSERWWKQQYVLREGLGMKWSALVFQAPDLAHLSLSAQKASPRPLLYSLFILGLDLIVHLPTPVHLEVGQIVDLKPSALSEINLEWTVIPPKTD